MPEGQPKSLNEQFIPEVAAVGLPWRLMVFFPECSLVFPFSFILG